MACEGNLENFLCLFIIKIGIRTLSTFWVLAGEVTMSTILGYGVILPSPIGAELLGSPARMLISAIGTKSCWKDVFSARAISEISHVAIRANRVQQGGKKGVQQRV
ncbi:MAG: hypothetical protein MN733_06375 [Nitrososphaera sp.]|nr:hypothetical protein [Nitrososphaera sp.]